MDLHPIILPEADIRIPASKKKIPKKEPNEALALSEMTFPVRPRKPSIEFRAKITARTMHIPPRRLS